MAGGREGAVRKWFREAVRQSKQQGGRAVVGE
jgi:hypothetical protein